MSTPTQPLNLSTSIEPLPLRYRIESIGEMLDRQTRIQSFMEESNNTEFITFTFQRDSFVSKMVDIENLEDRTKI